MKQIVMRGFICSSTVNMSYGKLKVALNVRNLRRTPSEVRCNK